MEHFFFNPQLGSAPLMLSALLLAGAHEPDNSKDIIKSKINHCEHHNENGAIVKPATAQAGDDQNIERA